MEKLLLIIGAGVAGLIVGRILPCKKSDRYLLNLVIQKLNQIIMTQAEATALVNDILAQVGKVKTEVETLITAVQNAGNVSPELESAITNVKTALQGVDDLNPDA